VGGGSYSGSNSDSLVTTHTYGSTTELEGGEKDGYNFGGWHLDPNAHDDPITSIGATEITSDITLYADWKRFGTGNVYKAEKLDSGQVVTVDGIKDEAYQDCTAITIDNIVEGSPAATATAYIAWKDSDIYVFIEVVDPTNYLYWDGDVNNYDRVKLFVDLYHNTESESATPPWGGYYRGDSVMAEGWYTIARGGPQYSETSNPRHGTNSVFEWNGWMSNASNDSGYTVGTSHTYDGGYTVEYRLDCSFDERIPDLSEYKEIGVGICVLDKISDSSAGNMVCIEDINENSVTSPAYLSNVKLVDNVTTTAANTQIATKTGGWVRSGETLTSTGSENVALVTGKTFTSGTIEVSMTAAEIQASGLLFCSDSLADTYYKLYMDSTSGNQMKLVKHTNSDTVLASCYVSVGYSYTSSVDLKVVYDRGNIKCFYNDKLLLVYTDSDPLSGNRYGIASNNVGSIFDNITMSTTSDFSEVDTLIIGHSYMELWENYQTDLAGYGYGDIMNIGIAGSSTTNWINHTEAIKAYHPSKIIYMIGINDFAGKASASTTLANVQTAINQVLTDLPNVEVCILSVNKVSNSNYKQYFDEIDTYNAYLKGYVNSSDRLYFGNMNNAYLDENGDPDPNCFTDDGLHLTEAAYSTIVTAINNGFAGIDTNTILTNLANSSNKIGASNWTIDPTNKTVTTNSNNGMVTTSDYYDYLRFTVRIDDTSAPNPYFDPFLTKEAILIGGHIVDGKYIGYALTFDNSGWIEVTYIDGTSDINKSTYKGGWSFGSKEAICNTDFTFTIRSGVLYLTQGGVTNATTVTLDGYIAGQFGILSYDGASTTYTFTEIYSK
ncbi:MAG: InlB B-repeat-containing protein, partial [Bacilli bacterium]|nr:InlB B-repeat-containing protein [Bacilli bacterium]